MVIQNTFGVCRAGGTQMLADKQRMRMDSRQVNMDLEILGTPQMFNQNDGRQIQIQLLVLLGPQLPWQILFCSFQKTLAKI